MEVLYRSFAVTVKFNRTHDLILKIDPRLYLIFSNILLLRFSLSKKSISTSCQRIHFYRWYPPSTLTHLAYITSSCPAGITDVKKRSLKTTIDNETSEAREKQGEEKGDAIMGWRENSYHAGQSGNNSSERHLIAGVNRSARSMPTFVHRAHTYVDVCTYTHIWYVRLSTSGERFFSKQWHHRG